jgi:hypothetical protein
MSITRKQLALLIYDSSLKWVDLEEDDAFNCIFRKYCPRIEVNSVCLPSRGPVIPPTVVSQITSRCKPVILT